MTTSVTWSVPSVLVAHERDRAQYLDAATEDAFHAACLHLLRERFQAGYWYPDPDQATEPTVDLDEAGLAHLTADSPTHELYRRQVSERDLWRRNQDRYVRWYSSARRALEIGDGELAWRCLRARSDHEYERVELERLVRP